MEKPTRLTGVRSEVACKPGPQLTCCLDEISARKLLTSWTRDAARPSVVCASACFILSITLFLSLFCQWFSANGTTIAGIHFTVAAFTNITASVTVVTSSNQNIRTVMPLLMFLISNYSTCITTITTFDSSDKWPYFVEVSNGKIIFKTMSRY